ncbi:MAG: hypothetical protein JXR76_29825 [Deltaproteobacteria bacterium]|nr:hypothetical protein [Deltaproteobacteria bacterium]
MNRIPRLLQILFAMAPLLLSAWPAVSKGNLTQSCFEMGHSGQWVKVRKSCDAALLSVDHDGIVFVIEEFDDGGGLDGEVSAVHLFGLGLSPRCRFDAPLELFAPVTCFLSDASGRGPPVL